MSVAQLKSELLSRTGRNLLPTNLPIEALISLAREWALFVNGALNQYEKDEFSGLLYDIVEKLLSAQKREYVLYIKKNATEQIPLLVSELNDLIRDELISRLIGYPYGVSLNDIFSEHFAFTDEPEISSTPAKK